MTRLYAVVEGHSEERFLESVIRQHLAASSVWLYPMLVLRSGGRGGGSSWQPYQRHIENLLRQHRGDDVRVTTMIDLYRVPADTPGWTAPGTRPGAARADAMLDAMGARVQDRRFIPYVQVHEFETLLFAELGALAQVAPDIVELRQFRALIQATQGAVPEEIDDGPSTAPSKRIEASTRGFRKTIHGLQAIQSIGLDRLRRACPRFNAWIAALEQL